ncbi:hypothetical protein JTF12_13935 [Leclercia adecarboxylata]|jgi:hypothetical protein|uniref:hypothetical protein n=1 Tax=Leclercia adecarboxylata TaxID=83655 RepID=UPI0019527629|nr:hypothetical protein [Leclercia adecarboxylata]MBM6635429.1 hypothetical protein [Leclercia adecarboxylata]
MRFLHLTSHELPEIDISIKISVNLGQWLLFRSDIENHTTPETYFYLKVGKEFFALSRTGGIISTLHSSEKDFNIDEIIYFSDLPKPISLSNSTSLDPLTFL